MMVNPDFVELAAEGFTNALDTDIGDKWVHYAVNLKDRDALPSVCGSGSGGPRQERSVSPGQRHQREERRHQIEQKKEATGWYRRSYWQSSRHQQQPMLELQARPNEAPPERWPRSTYWKRKPQQKQQQSKPRETAGNYDKRMAEEAYNAAVAWEQRCDQFRLQKNAYTPPKIERPQQLSWDEDKLYDDVSRAVRQATRRSGEMARGGR